MVSLQGHLTLRTKKWILGAFDSRTVKAPATLGWKGFVQCSRLLLAKNVEGCRALCQKVLHLPTYQGPRMAPRPLLTTPVPPGPWEDVILDFVTGLQQHKGIKIP